MIKTCRRNQNSLRGGTRKTILDSSSWGNKLGRSLQLRPSPGLDPPTPHRGINITIASQSEPLCSSGFPLWLTPPLSRLSRWLRWVPSPFKGYSMKEHLTLWADEREAPLPKHQTPRYQTYHSQSSPSWCWTGHPGCPAGTMKTQEVSEESLHPSIPCLGQPWALAIYLPSSDHLSTFPQPWIYSFNLQPEMVGHTCNPNTRAGRLGVLGPAELYRVRSCLNKYMN